MELQRDKKLVLTRQCKPATEPTNPGYSGHCVLVDSEIMTVNSENKLLIYT